MTASTADYYGILGLTSDATLADVKKAYRKLARQHHPDRNNADPGAIGRFRRITEAYEYLSAHLKDNAHGNGHSRPGPAAPPRADVGMPGENSEAASRVLTMLEETWQAIRARHPEMPSVVIIIASGTTGPDARWGRFDPQRWTVHATGTRQRSFSFRAPRSHIFEGGTACVDLAHGRRRSIASPPPFHVSPALADHHDPVMTNNLPGGKPESAAKTRTARLRRST
jgi:curved DNA-binding protein CbpA